MLNYHQLRYFLAVAQSGTLSRASSKVKKTPQTLSHQIQTLEESLGVALFERKGRRLILTEAGEKAVHYAKEIFALGEDMVDALEMKAGTRTLRLRVGVADVLPKRVAHALIRPALQLPEKVRIECLESTPERLMADLAVEDLDLVLSDAPPPRSVAVRASSQLLMESGVQWMAAPDIAKSLRKGFPSSLSTTPLLLPTERAAMRRGVDRWLDKQGIHTEIAGEFDDFALMGVFAQGGTGAIAVPTLFEREAALAFNIEQFGEMDGVSVRFFAHCLRHSLQHVVVRAILDANSTMTQPQKHQAAGS